MKKVKTFKTNLLPYTNKDLNTSNMPTRSILASIKNTILMQVVQDGKG